MTVAYESLHIVMFLAFSTFCFSSICTTTTITTSLASSPTASNTKPRRLVSKLIHSRSVLHPHYNPIETAKDRMERDIKHSIARFAYLQARAAGFIVYDGDYSANLSPDKRGHLMLANFSIGQPPIPQLLAVDTASDLLWVACIPCSNCILPSVTIFDPSKSSTFSPLCGSPTCNSTSYPSGQDTFNITYADNTRSSGIYAYEQLVFETSDEGTSLVQNILFGCSHNNWFRSQPAYNGILGLNNQAVSLASQIGEKFSYCIGSLHDSNYNYNQLILGEGADLEGYSTPFKVFDGQYYITMEGISVGEKRLDIAPGTFERKENATGGVAIDSGSPVTYLVEDAYKVLYKEVRSLLDGLFREVKFVNLPWLLCYSGTVTRDLVGFPVVTFHFAGGADLALDTGSFFDQTADDAFCMTVGPVNAHNIGSKPTVIGLFAQQGYNIGYDLVDQFIYVQRIDCELLSG